MSMCVRTPNKNDYLRIPFAPLKNNKNNQMKKILLVAFALINILKLNAQECCTDELEQLLLTTNPQYASERTALENFIQQRSNTNARIANTGCQPILSTYIVPIVVHVMHLGEAVGTATNISDAQIADAMSGLNSRWAFMNIQFVLAKRDPNGNATNGITRTDCSAVPNYASIGIDPSPVPTGAPDTTIKKMSIWPWQKYVNFWVIAKAANNNAYANMPSTYAYQGIVFIYSGMYSANSGQSHEMGHYMNLYHTFQGSTGSVCSQNTDPNNQGDKIADTPPHLQTDCNYISCGRYTDSLNSLRNFMSYCPGQNRFTQGQKDRVIASLFSEYRWSLVTSDGLIPATTFLEAKIDYIANNATENVCTNFTPKVRIKNLGTNVLSNCKIQTYIDDVLQNTTSITAINLQKDSSKIVSLLPVLSVYNTHSFRFVLSQINGSDTDFLSLNNSICGDITLVRNNYTVAVSSNNGTTTGNGSYACDSVANLTATPNTCYQFTNWTENGNIVSTNSIYSFPVTANRNLVANFELKQFSITLSNTPGVGTVSGGGDIFCGSSVTVRATPFSCYTFKNWTENGTIVSTIANYTFTVSSSRNLVANFDKKRFTITVSSDNIANGTVTGNGSYGCDTITTVIATPASCYTFTKWTENGNTVSTNASYSFTVTANRNLIANFTKKRYSISLSPNDASKGTVTGNGSYGCDTTVTVKAKIKTGAVWQNWTENGNIVSTDSVYTFTATANRTLVANFTAAIYTIAITANIANAGTLTGGGAISYETNTSIAAIPASCYTFKNWTENGSTVSANANYSFTVNGNRSLVANFDKKRYLISLSPNDINKGTVTGGGNYGCDTSVTVRANIKTGAKWVNWTENSNVVSTDSVFTFTASANRNLVANFVQVITAIKQTTINEISKIYPNPANEILQIEIRSKQNTSFSLNIIDMKGSLLETKTINNTKGISNTSFDVSKLSKGNYLLNLYDEDGMASYKFVVQ